VCLKAWKFKQWVSGNAIECRSPSSQAAAAAAAAAEALAQIVPLSIFDC
jgi:hypothetical protein